MSSRIAYLNHLQTKEKPPALLQEQTSVMFRVEMEKNDVEVKCEEIKFT